MAKAAKKPVFTSPLTTLICSRIKDLFHQKKKEYAENGEKLTYDSFGKIYGLEEPYIKGIMRSNFAPSHDVLASIAKKENLSVDYFYGFTATPIPIRKK
jgi:transcriptional regulator with XRE-family HTH domain